MDFTINMKFFHCNPIINPEKCYMPFTDIFLVNKFSHALLLHFIFKYYILLFEFSQGHSVAVFSFVFTLAVYTLLNFYKCKKLFYHSIYEKWKIVFLKQFRYNFWVDLNLWLLNKKTFQSYTKLERQCKKAEGM